MPSWSCSCNADMPLECVVIRCAAQNHVVSGNLERCITVPAVTEACRPQSRHSCKRGRLFNAATRRLPQAGEKKTFGPPGFESKAAQPASVRKGFLNYGNNTAVGNC